MSIATCQRDAPWAAAAFYVNRGFVFYFLSDPGTTHCRQIEANPRVALTIHEDYRDWREIKGFQIEGLAERVWDEGEIGEAWRLYVGKFPFVRELLPTGYPGEAGPPGSDGKNAGEVERRLGSVRFFKVTATRVVYTDNARGFGHREEIPLP